MTRSRKNIVDYFPHDSRASEGDTLTIVESRHGHTGYAFWFKLLEKLSYTENHVIYCSNPVKWQLLLAKFGVTEQQASDILNLLASLNAIDKDLWEAKTIWSQHLVDNVADVYRNRKRPVPVRPISIVDKSITTVDNGITTTCNPQSKVKESKVKEKKVYRAEIELPEWIDQKTWDGYLEMRRAKGKPPTQRALELIASALGQMRERGIDANKALNQSIVNNWTDVYEPKENGNGHRRDDSNIQALKGLPGNRPTGAFADIETD